MPLFIPEDYTAKLAPETMEQAITYLKEIFPDMLARRLRLRRVTAPLFVLSGTGINDDLNGVERAVSFPIRDLGDRRAEVVHSLAKWKRMKLGTYKIAPGYGLYTDMNAIRADEELDNIHSLYVDQWDWERTMRPEERNLNFLKATVETIYEAMKAVEEEVYELYPHITPILPERITFLQAEELLQEFPALTPKEREQVLPFTAVVIQHQIDHPEMIAPHSRHYRRNTIQRTFGDIRAFNTGEVFTGEHRVGVAEHNGVNARHLA